MSVTYYANYEHGVVNFKGVACYAQLGSFIKSLNGNRARAKQFHEYKTRDFEWEGANKIVSLNVELFKTYENPNEVSEANLEAILTGLATVTLFAAILDKGDRAAYVQDHKVTLNVVEGVHNEVYFILFNLLRDFDEQHEGRGKWLYDLVSQDQDYKDNPNLCMLHVMMVGKMSVGNTNSDSPLRVINMSCHSQVFCKRGYYTDVMKAACTGDLTAMRRHQPCGYSLFTEGTCLGANAFWDMELGDTRFHNRIAAACSGNKTVSNFRSVVKTIYNIVMEGK